MYYSVDSVSYSQHVANHTGNKTIRRYLVVDKFVTGPVPPPEKRRYDRVNLSLNRVCLKVQEVTTFSQLNDPPEMNEST